jgi:hypothetical protein
MCQPIAEGGRRCPSKETTQSERDEKLAQLRDEEVQANADATNRHADDHGLRHADWQRARGAAEERAHMGDFEPPGASRRDKASMCRPAHPGADVTVRTIGARLGAPGVH